MEENIRHTKVDCIEAIDEYIDKSDWRVKANSNGTYSHAGLVCNLAGKVISNYWLDKVYSKEEGDYHRNGDYHIHDLDILAPYCCGHDLQQLLQEGFNGVTSRVSARPPKHFREALGQMANYIGILQSEWAGAQAFSSFDTLLAPYVFYDRFIEGHDEKEFKKALVSFVYNLNVPSRFGQSPFSNITIDMVVPDSMQNVPPMKGDKPYFVSNWEDDKDNPNWKNLIDEARKRLGDNESDDETILYSLTYKCFMPEMLLINKLFYEILSTGDSIGQPFTFPIPTVNITEDFPWDDERYDFLFENAAKYGSSYFNNFIGSMYKKDENGNKVKDEKAFSVGDVKSMCCRLRLDLTQLHKRGGGLFGSNPTTGSIGNVTINMARLGYLCKGDMEKLYERLGKLMDAARSTLEKKRVFCKELYNRGLYPYTRRYIKSYDTYFSTIGVNGMNEMVRNFTNDEHDITDEFGQKMAKDVLEWFNKRLTKYQSEGKTLYNCEASPAEGAMRRLAKSDQKRFGSYMDEIYYINCPVHGEVKIEPTEEDEVVCPKCQKCQEEEIGLIRFDFNWVKDMISMIK